MTWRSRRSKIFLFTFLTTMNFSIRIIFFANNSKMKLYLRYLGIIYEVEARGEFYYRFFWLMLILYYDKSELGGWQKKEGAKVAELATEAIFSIFKSSVFFRLRNYTTHTSADIIYEIWVALGISVLRRRNFRFSPERQIPDFPPHHTNLDSLGFNN